MLNNFWWESPYWSKDEILRKTEFEFHKTECEIHKTLFGDRVHAIYQGKYIDFAIINNVQTVILKEKEKTSVNENKKFIYHYLKENVDKLPYNFLKNTLRVDPEMSELFELGG